MRQINELRPALAALDEVARRQLLDTASTLKLSADQFVFHLGDACGAFVILLDGRARVQLTSAAGREIVSRQFKRMEANRWLRLGRGHIKVADRDALLRLADEGAV